MKKDSLFKGTVILSVSLLLTKLIGLIYIIPFYQIIGGDREMSIFNYGYNIYIIILEVSAAGIPLAIAKLIAKYNALENYTMSRSIVKVGTTVIMAMGILGFLILFFGADIIARNIIISKEQAFKVEDMALIIRCLSFAVPVVLAGTSLKGIFQGHEIMLPSALSQFFEQVIRIVFLLGGTYVVLSIMHKGLVLGNAVATFATSIGALCSFSILFYFFVKNKNTLEYMKVDYYSEKKVSNSWKILKEILSVSIPFICISTLFPILTLIDQQNFVNVMENLGKSAQTDNDFTVLTNINKIVMVAVALSPAFSNAFLPSVTKLYVKGQVDEVSSQINKVILSLMMIVLPALVGMYVLADPIYSFFYRPNPDNLIILRSYLPLAVVFSTYGMTSIIMQAINKQKLNIITIFIGITFKFYFNEYFISMYQSRGVILCSMLTYILMIFVNLIIINREVKLRIKEFLYGFSLLLLSCGIMFIFVAALYTSIYTNFVNTKLSNMILISICAVLGGSFYFWIVNKLNFFHFIFGKTISLKKLLRRG